MMLLNLAYQWEADSMASRSISGIVSLYNPAPEVWAAWQEISSNEVVHAATYSEIIRNSFDDPAEVLEWILKIEQAVGRLSHVAEVMGEAHDRGHKFALERIQFMSSFAVTFAICDASLFQPIGKSIQKIANDEFKIHVEMDREVLRNELKTKRGKVALEQCSDKIKKLIDEVTNAELQWIDFLFSEGRELVGVNADLMKKWVLFNARPVYEYFKMKPEHKCPTTNPLKYMEDWLDISNIQPAPQEQDIGDYKVNVVRRDDQDEMFDDFD
jgi:ribonucleoside-diphosphate reductase beta chain